VLTGVRQMRKLPAMVFVVDVLKEHIAVDEARRLRIPIGAVIDTNCDPDAVDYPIPGNDDAIKSVQLVAKAIADAVCTSAGNLLPEEVVTGARTESGAAEPAAVAAEGEAEVREGVEEEEPEGEDGAGAGSARKRRVVHRRVGAQDTNTKA